MRDYKKLLVWERSHKFALEIYNLSKSFPKEELYGITSQIRRAALSIPTNIAEGSDKYTSKDFSRYLGIASGSASEVDYLLLFVKELKIVDNDKVELLINEINEIKKMLNAFQSKIISKD
ncbi:MAG: four helix bundle protein [Bacteroidota bacterium]